MPKCESDPALQDQLTRYVTERKLSVRAAASELEVEHSGLSRFLNTGLARADTRAKYREALNKRATNTATSVAVPSGAVAAVRRSLHEGVLGERELRQIRRACEGVLKLVDVYEAQLARGRA